MTDTGWIPGYEEAMKANAAQREDVMHRFGEFLDLPVKRLVREGKDPATARYFIECSNGDRILLGAIDTLLTVPALNKVLGVRIGKLVTGIRPAPWTVLMDRILRYATDSVEVDDEGLAGMLRDWLGPYLRSASHDREGALNANRPFYDEDHVHLPAERLATFIRREYSENIKLHELRAALRDLGFKRQTLNYMVRSGTIQRRSSASYYTAPVAVLNPKSTA